MVGSCYSMSSGAAEINKQNISSGPAVSTNHISASKSTLTFTISLLHSSIKSWCSLLPVTRELLLICKRHGRVVSSIPLVNWAQVDYAKCSGPITYLQEITSWPCWHSVMKGSIIFTLLIVLIMFQWWWHLQCKRIHHVEYQQFLKDVKDKPLRLISFGFVKTEHWITIALYTIHNTTLIVCRQTYSYLLKGYTNNWTSMY